MKITTKAKLQKILANICRAILAITFIFSGFIKANDPYGTVYKLQDYFASIGRIQLPEFIVVLMAIGLAFLEFTLGIYLLFGINRKKVSSFTVLFMLFMTAITVYVNLFNPVSDCGCFGDAIILSNGATLLKNLVLLCTAIILKRLSVLQIEIVPDKFKWIISTISMTSILAFTATCIYSLPLIDFRPYRVGTDLKGNYESYSDPSNFEIKIIYKKNGETLELSTEDDDPDDSWTYVETQRIIKNEDKLTTSNFYFTDAETEEDITQEILFRKGISFLLIIPDLRHADESCTDRINDLTGLSEKEGYGLYCLTASIDKNDHKYWDDHTGAEYKYCIGDDKLLKTIVRGKPGLVMLKDGIIIHKWSNYNMPDADNIQYFIK